VGYRTSARQRTVLSPAILRLREQGCISARAGKNVTAAKPSRKANLSGALLSKNRNDPDAANPDWTNAQGFIRPLGRTVTG
jgi:hypothetical protein